MERIEPTSLPFPYESVVRPALVRHSFAAVEDTLKEVDHYLGDAEMRGHCSTLVSDMYKDLRKSLKGEIGNEHNFSNGDLDLEDLNPGKFYAIRTKYEFEDEEEHRLTHVYGLGLLFQSEMGQNYLTDIKLLRNRDRDLEERGYRFIEEGGIVVAHKTSEITILERIKLAHGRKILWLSAVGIGATVGVIAATKK